MINIIKRIGVKLKTLAYNLFFEKIWVLFFKCLSRNKEIILIKNAKINN